LISVRSKVQIFPGPPILGPPILGVAILVAIAAWKGWDETGP
jgi:hypothetical protein